MEPNLEAFARAYGEVRSTGAGDLLAYRAPAPQFPRELG
jgi:hypothetical protein